METTLGRPPVLVLKETTERIQLSLAHISQNTSFILWI